MTGNKEIPFAKSIVDYIAQWLHNTFIVNVETEKKVDKPVKKKVKATKGMDMPVRICPNCGGQATPNGTCYRCDNCGESLGCS